MLVWSFLRRLVVWALALAIASVVLLALARGVGVWMMARAEPGTQAVPPGEVVTIGNATLHFTDRGAGPAIVLLHGVPGWSGDWPEALAAHLAQRHRVVAPDLLGFGFSPRPVDVGMTAWGTEVLRLLEDLGVRGATIVGFDAGAAAALAAADADPEIAARLVLIAPAVPMPGDEKSWRSFLLEVPGAGEVMAGWSASLLRPADMPPSLAAGPWWSLPGTRRCALTALRDGVPPDPLAAAMHRIRVPTLVLHGTADGVVPWPVARRWVPSIPGVLVRLVDGGGHWLPAERPDEVAGAILHFMEDQR